MIEFYDDSKFFHSTIKSKRAKERSENSIILCLLCCCLLLLELPSNERLPETSMEESSCKIQAERHPGNRMFDRARQSHNVVIYQSWPNYCWPSILVSGFHFCLTVLCITLRDTGNELVPTAATIENQSTLDTFKGPASKVQRSTITKSVATKSSITAKEEDISLVVPSTTSDVLRQKQTSSGLEDFLLLRKGKHDTLKPPSHRQCTPPSKKEMIIE